MKCQILFSGKNKKTIINLSYAESFIQSSKRLEVQISLFFVHKGNYINFGNTNTNKCKVQKKKSQHKRPGVARNDRTS